MNHGENKLNLKQAPVYEDEEPQKTVQEAKSSRKNLKTRIITVKTTSLTEGNLSGWTPQPMSHQENSSPTIKSSPCQQVSTPSRPLFFWEVLMTVALLITALWMQGLPARQMPENMDHETLPSFEITKPQMVF